MGNTEKFVAVNSLRNGPGFINRDVEMMIDTAIFEDPTNFTLKKPLLFDREMRSQSSL